MLVGSGEGGSEAGNSNHSLKLFFVEKCLAAAVPVIEVHSRC
jgi:hypothetical protein